MGVLAVALPVIYTAAAASSAYADPSSHRRELLQTAGCDVFISTTTTSQSVRLAVDAAAEATAVICGDAGSARDEIEAVAEATARAAASAVADVVATCYANGNGSFKINGLTRAQAEATAYAEAYAEGTVRSSACNRCSAAAEFVATSWSRIFFDAVAEAEISLQGAANGGTVRGATTAFVEAVAEATVIAYASVLATASASVDDDCNVSILTTTASGDVLDADETACDIDVSGVSNTIDNNAVASAVFEARAFACEGRAEAGGRIAAMELATATAQAISTVVADCAVIGNGLACALGEADVNTMARATASAFSRGFVNAVSECDPPRCTISVEAITENAEEVLVKAASDAYAIACAGSDDYFAVEDIEEDIATATIDALAEVIVRAVVDGDDCSVAVSTQANTVPDSKCDGDCAGRNKKCGGRGMDEVLHCCNDADRCVKKNNNFMQCRRNGTPGGSDWDGSIVPCGKQ